MRSASRPRNAAQRRRLARVLLAGAAGVALVTAGATSASAGEPDSAITLSSTQEAEIRTWWTDADVAVETQDALIANLELGILPESSTNASPLTTLHETLDGTDRTICVYSDGSRRIVSQQIAAAEPRTGISSFANTIAGCVSSGGWRVNCKVKVEDALSGSSFVIDWYPVNGGAKVRDMRLRICWNSVGGCEISGGIKRATQSGTAPAWAEQTFKAWVGPVQAVTGAFGIRALNTTATMYHPF